VTGAVQGIGLAFGVAMDAAAVAAARALGSDTKPRDGLVLAGLFGVFQAGMAALGYLLAHVGGEWFDAIDHWIAFLTLVGIGGKMLRDAWRQRGGREENEAVASLPSDRIPWRGYVALAIATSVDAAAVGMSLPLVQVDPWLAIALMGLVTFGCTGLSFAIARSIGRRLGTGVDAFGGVVLIAIGVKVLVERL
jgi:putative Mn2+ efflux pump MntP